MVDGIESESYTTGGLKEGKTYEFYVTIYDPDTDREGPMSNIVSITTDSEWPGPGDPPGVETTMDSENDDGSINMESGTDGDPINEETVTGSNFIKQVWDTDKLDYIGATSRIKAMVSIKSEEDPFDIKLSLKYLDNDDWKTVSEETAEIDADFDYEKVIKDFTLTSDSYYNNDRYRNKKWRLVIDNAGEIEKEFEIENIPEIKITKCSDPYDPDTDSDGLDDNEELLEGTEILNPDTDGDTLSDGLEVNGWTSIVDGESERFTSNPLKNIDLDGDGYNDVEEYNYGTDPHNSDTDEDGLEDDVEIEGWHIRYKANYDFGIQGSDDDNMMKVESSPLWTDTDNDGLDDLQEYTNGTHPANSDSDWDGLDDLQEIENYGTNPVDYDTDGDGVYDEIECTDSGEVKYLGEIISNEGLDPVDPDTDNDGIIDGKEKYGYNITYFTGLGNNTEKNRTINNSDPLTAYKYDNGTWIDTDRDGIIDAIEQNYSLVMDSIFDDVEGINDTRMFYMYHVSQGNEEILQLHFNPYITDMMKPYSLEFKVRNDFNGGDPEGDVEMRIFDSSGIDYVKITNEDQDNSKIIDGSELHNEGEFYVLYESIDIDGSDDYWLDGWDIRVKVVDENGNSYKLERHVKSETVQGWQYFTDWLIGYLQEEVDRTMEMIGEVTQILADSLKYNLRSLSKLPLMEEVRMSAQTIRAIRRNSMSNYFELFPFPTYYQGSYGLCAALCCKMVARYYGHDATIEEINKTFNYNVYEGMYSDDVIEYINKTGYYEDKIKKKKFNKTFNEIKTQLNEQKDPIVVTGLDDFYEAIGISSESHDVVIVSYYEDDGEKGVVIADSHIAVTGYTYMVSWDYLKEHLKDNGDKLIFTEGNGMAS
ncbi:MAG: C39 family peptidase [Thermoplasmata archaeon]